MIKRHPLPILLDVCGHPYLVDPVNVDFAPDGVPLPENIYPELDPDWDGPGAIVQVDDGETIDIMGRRFLVNLIGDVELVALALPGESEFDPAIDL